MIPTSLTLLDEAKAGSEAAWKRLYDLYFPFLKHWLIRWGITSKADAEDLAHDVLTVVVDGLPRFEHRGNNSFRNWLRGIAHRRALGHVRKIKIRGRPEGGTGAMEQLQQLEDPDSEASQRWNEEHDRYVKRVLLERAKGEFGKRNSKTYEAFHQLVFDGKNAEEVRLSLEMESTSAVYNAKSRVLQWLRANGRFLVDDSRFS